MNGRRTSGCRRSGAGHRSSAKIASLGSRATLALISEVPPSPQPVSTVTSGPTWKSNRPTGDPWSALAVWTWISRAADSAEFGYSPGCSSLPRSRTHTSRPARAMRAAAIAPPYPEPITTAE